MKPILAMTCVMTVLNLVLPAFAQSTLYETSFEPPAFVERAAIRGQDGWEMFGDGIAISVSTTNANSGVQCLRFDGSLLEPQASGNSLALAQLSSEALAALSGEPPPSVIEIQCDVRLDGPQVGTTGDPKLDKLSANFYAGGAAKYAGGFVVSSAGRIWTMSFAPGELYKYSVLYEFGSYRTLTLRVNYLARTLTYLVDGKALGSSPMSPSYTDDRLGRADLLVVGPTDPIHDAEIDYEPANYTAYYDNYRIKALPISAAPEIDLRVSDQSLTSGTSETDFGSVTLGAASPRTFTIRNLGGAELSEVSATVEGQGFSIDTTPSAGMSPGGESNFVVSFTPSVVGESKGTLRIRSNDQDEGTFVVALHGSGTELVSQWPSNVGITLRTNEYPSYLTAFTQVDGKLIVNVGVEWYKDTNFFEGGTRFWRVIRLNTDGTVDPSFPAIEHRPSAEWYTQLMFPASDGTFYLHKDYDRTFSRFKADGARDSSFPTLTFNRFLQAIGQPDGKVLIYDRYSDDVGVTVSGKRVPWLFRLNSNGSIDTSFNAATNLAGLKRTLYDYFLEPGGKLIGVISSINRGPTNLLFRLNADGSQDSGFALGKGALKGDSHGGNGLVSSIGYQPDGKIVVGGRFREFNGKPANSIVRLNVDGSVDESFAAGRGFEGFLNENPNGFISDIRFTTLSDGRLIVYGSFLTFDGQTAGTPLLLHADGTRSGVSLPTGLVDVVAATKDGMVYYNQYPAGLGEIVQLNRLRLPDAEDSVPFRLVSIVRGPNGSTTLTVETKAAVGYTLQASTDLVTWTDLSSQIATGPTLEFTDQTLLTSRYYRVKRAP